MASKLGILVFAAQKAMPDRRGTSRARTWGPCPALPGSPEAPGSGTGRAWRWNTPDALTTTPWWSTARAATPPRGLAQTVLSARREAQTHEYARGAERYRVGVTRQGRDGVSVRIEPIKS